MDNHDKASLGRLATWAAAILGVLGLVVGAARIGLKQLLWLGTCIVGGVGLWTTLA